VTYNGIGAKYDCDSPVIGALHELRSGAVQYSVQPGLIVADTAIVMVMLRTDRDSLRVPYHLVNDGTRWRIVSRLWLTTQGWRRRETKYSAIHFQDSTLINSRALDQLDRFVDSLATEFHMPDTLRTQLAMQKIEYYLCDESAMQRISGFSVHGMTSTPFDAVVTRHLPHYHELVHAVANIAMRHMPLHRLPCFQEGLAVCLGGRWEKSPEVLMQLGDFMLRQQMGSIAQILSYDGFNQSGNLDMSYALSGLLCGYVIDQIGIDGFLEMMRNRSGSDTRVRTMDTQVLKYSIAGAVGVPWDTLAARVADYAATYRDRGLHAGPDWMPEKAASTMPADSMTVVLNTDDSRIYFEVHARNDHPHGIILIDPPDGETLDGYQSRLFAKQAPGLPYDGALYGIEFNAEEAGLYAYDTDVLLAKYVHSFDPNPNYWDAKNRVLRFSIDKSLLPSNISTKAWRLSQIQN